MFESPGENIVVIFDGGIARETGLKALNMFCWKHRMREGVRETGPLP